MKLLQHEELNLSMESHRLAAEKILLYNEEWKVWNAKINLTGRGDELSSFHKHVFDSLQFARMIPVPCTVLDIGSGAGFPGIPLKCCFPELRVTLVESQRKRANFLRTVAQKLSLTDLIVVHERSEHLEGQPEYQGQYDRVLFRAVSSTRKCLELGLPFLKPDGCIILKKPPRGEDLLAPPSLKLNKTLLIKDINGVSSHLHLFEKCST